ncbi:hypothetical protein A6R68_10860 [Neotoma lepida]|uniref:Uncharacterized protein n=1 Tax=Neotoma lepida TaxID=56216 RepID=A0A1A6FVN6_NEOLE|nr:hypothetical protein A6R68_10860 [Neotoma lepida]
MLYYVYRTVDGLVDLILQPSSLKESSHLPVSLYLAEAILHPDTNEKIFMPFRMSGYIPFGTPIGLRRDELVLSQALVPV